MMTDPIADMLTRIRNGAGARKASVDVPWSRHKEAIAHVLVEEGYLAEAAMVREGQFPTLRLGLRYDQTRRSVISGIRRVSRPSLDLRGQRRDPVGASGARREHPLDAQGYPSRPRGTPPGRGRRGDLPDLVNGPVTTTSNEDS